MSNSLLLFVDQLVMYAVGGWLYWIIISKITSASEIGQATEVYSLVNLVASLASLGLEYPLLKRSHDQMSSVLATSLLIQLAVTMAAVPLSVYVISIAYEGSFEVILVAMVILITWAVVLAARYAILGTSNAKVILVIDTLATASKFISGYVLVSFNFGSLGILLSIMLFNVGLAVASIYFAKKAHGFTLSSVANVFPIIKEGIVNMPSITSRTLVYSLSVALLAPFGIGDAEVGTFYVVLMISLFAGGLITSTAYMLLPFSSKSGSDLSLGSTRLALSLTVPIIVALVSAPQFWLSSIAEEYIYGHEALMVLSIAILPFSVVTLSISRLNYLGEARKIAAVGGIQCATFVIAFALLTFQHGILGASFSILISYTISSVPCLIWSERTLLRYIINSVAAVALGGLIGYLFYEVTNIAPFIAISTSVTVSVVLIIALKNTSIEEIRSLAHSVTNINKISKSRK